MARGIDLEKSDPAGQKQDKREVILQTALELLAANGFQHTPMSLIVKQSGASAGIIYHYFASKEELIQAVYRRAKSELSHAILAPDMESVPLGELFPSLWMRAFHFYATHPYETAFLEQYESAPDKGLHFENPSEDEAALYHLVEQYQSQQLLKDLPFSVLYELTLGVALRLARYQSSGQLTTDEATLTNIARACWDAIAR